MDGSVDTRWSSSFQDNQWISVDLGVVYELFAVTVQWETAYARDYLVQSALDEPSWHTAATVTINEPGEVQTLFPEHFARYVRILCQTRATPWGCSILELQVFPASLDFSIPLMVAQVEPAGEVRGPTTHLLTTPYFNRTH